MILGTLEERFTELSTNFAKKSDGHQREAKRLLEEIATTITSSFSNPSMPLLPYAQSTYDCIERLTGEAKKHAALFEACTTISKAIRNPGEEEHTNGRRALLTLLSIHPLGIYDILPAAGRAREFPATRTFNDALEELQPLYEALGGESLRADIIRIQKTQDGKGVVR